MTATIAPVDERVPVGRLVPLALQHVLAMAAAPVSTVFLTATALRLSPAETASVLSAVLVLCGAGSLLQSLGVGNVGARLPFIMLPGGAATALFIQISADHGPAVASGSVLLAAALLLAAVPLYGRIVWLFPPLVMGVTVLLIGIAMVRVAAQLITGPTGETARGSVVLAGATVAVTLAAYLFLRGVWRQSAVLIGMVAGTAIAVAGGPGSGFSLPALFPYGTPRFDVLAALPLLVFSLSTLAEITGQTVLNSETSGRTPDPGRDVPRIARADALMSLFAGTLGASLMVTSSENIGISRLTGVRSRFVTAAAGGVLVAVGLLSPLSRAVAGLPPAVVGGSALVVYAVIAVMGVQMLARSELAERGHSMIAALALAVGLLPIVAPTLYDGFPGWIRTLLGSGVVAGTLTAVLLHALFTIADRPPRTGAGARQSGERQSRERPPLTTPGRPRSADRAPAPPEG